MYKEKPLIGYPRGDYLARNDGGLHLNIPGTAVFGERVKGELSLGYIKELVRRAGFTWREVSYLARGKGRRLGSCLASA